MSFDDRIHDLLIDCTVSDLEYLKQMIGTKEIELHMASAKAYSIGQPVGWTMDGEPHYGLIEKLGIISHRVKTDTTDSISVKAGYLHHLKD